MFLQQPSQTNTRHQCWPSPAVSTLGLQTCGPPLPRVFHLQGPSLSASKLNCALQTSLLQVLLTSAAGTRCQSGLHLLSIPKVYWPSLLKPMFVDFFKNFRTKEKQKEYREHFRKSPVGWCFLFLSMRGQPFSLPDSLPWISGKEIASIWKVDILCVHVHVCMCGMCVCVLEIESSKCSQLSTPPGHFCLRQTVTMLPRLTSNLWPSSFSFSE